VADYNPNSYNAILSRIETKLDALTEKIDADAGDLEKFKVVIYKKVEKLEQFKYYLLGSVALGSMIASSVISYFLKK